MGLLYNHDKERIDQENMNLIPSAVQAKPDKKLFLHTFTNHPSKL